MKDLSMSQNTFCGIVKSYTHRPFFVGMDADDLEDLFLFVSDLLDAEADAIKETEPYATKTIEAYESASTTVDTFRFYVRDAFEECYPDEDKAYDRWEVEPSRDDWDEEE